MALTQDIAKEFMHYDPLTGVFLWKPRKYIDGQDKRFVDRFNKHNAGKVAGSLSDIGYLISKLDGKLVKLHRVAWLYVHGYMPDFIDHINGNRSDNRIENLREASKQVNGMNQGMRLDNKSGCSGVYWNSGLKKWHVRIGYKKSRKHIGWFANLDDAVVARNDAVKALGYSEDHGVRPSFERNLNLKRLTK